MPLVSIIIPSFNQAEYLTKTLTSVFEQTYSNIEIIVIDGGSVDKTVEILKNQEDRIFWISEKDRGQAHAINKGLNLAKGEFVTWLCSDDYYKPTAIQTMVEPMLQDSDVGLTYAESYYIIDNDEETIWGIKAPGELTLHKLLIKGESLAQPSSLIRRSVLDRIGYLDEKLKYAMDYDLWIRLVKITKSVYVAEPLSYYRLHSFSKTVEGVSSSSREVLTIMRKYGVSRYNKNFMLRQISIVKSEIKKMLGIPGTPINKWAMWKSKNKKFT